MQWIGEHKYEISNRIPIYHFIVCKTVISLPKVLTIFFNKTFQK